MGLTFRNKHSYKDMGMDVKVLDMPISPPAKTEFEEGIPYMDGSLNFSETGGRIFYKDKVLEVEFYLINSNTEDRNKKIEKFIAWINGGKGELILDDMPNVIWTAIPVTVEDMTVMLKRAGKTIVEFRCEPFNKFIFDTSGFILDSNIPLSSDIPLDWPLEHNRTVTNGINKFTLLNDGTVPVRPVIHFNGTFTKVTLTVNGKTFVYNHNTDSFTINCELFVCTENETDTTEYSQGDFFELNPGENEISIECNGEGSVFFEYKPLFYFNEVIL